MGWASGSIVMEKIVSFASKYVPDETARQSFYTEMISALEDQDWDCQDEFLGQDDAYDAAIKELHPEWCNEER